RYWDIARAIWKYARSKGSFPSSTARRARTSAASWVRASDGRRLHSLAARSAVAASFVSLAASSSRAQMAATSLSSPYHARKAPQCRESNVFFGLEAAAVANALARSARHFFASSGLFVAV